jgi:UDP-GlcNAc:undecaprenyl-phosphate/decaprenyl-phosphate GlcNAc-1-phosphate transferase
MADFLVTVGNSIFLKALGGGLFSFILALGLTPIAIKLAWRFGLIDDPLKHRHAKVVHTYPVPRGGGLPLLIAIATAAAYLLPLDQHLKGILIGAMIVVITGLLDDRYDLNPILRLGFNFLAGAAVVGAGIGIAFLSNPFGGTIPLNQPQISFNWGGEMRSIWILADLFAVFWIAWTMNFVSMSSGIDGQISGVIAIAAIIIGIIGFRYSADITQWPVTILAFITAGAFLGFLPWHMYPQKIMPSYSGATLGGFMLAVLSLLSTAKVGTLMLVLGIPFLDITYTVMRRILSGKSPFTGDRGHLHHKLLDMGWSKKKIAIFYWAVTLVLGILSLYLNSKQKLYTIITVATLVGGFLLWVNYYLISSKQRGPGNGLKT